MRRPARARTRSFAGLEDAAGGCCAETPATRHGSLGKTDLQKCHRVCRVFLSRLLMVHGEDAPEVLRRIADELEWLAQDAQRIRSRRPASRRQPAAAIGRA
jgi:hypothetical protein